MNLLRFKLILPNVPALALLLCAVIDASAQTKTSPDPIEGKWYGVAGFPLDRVELGFEFKRNAKNELKAYSTGW
ncbi:MAG TPA: hypothetical protein VN643_08570 [Pyrinomonadaceae bacterium]|nr:hypothetical protein [Pyrinomonadaceae bacterium]